MKKTLAFILLTGFLIALSTTMHAKPPTFRYKVEFVGDKKITSGTDHSLYQWDAILVCNLVDFHFTPYPMVWAIGSPTGQLHEHQLCLSNATSLSASGIHRLKHSK